MKKKKNKILNIFLTVFILVDMIHYFLFRFNPKYSNITEAFYESDFTTFAKWILCFLSIMIFSSSEKNKNAYYLLIVVSLLMILLSVINGPLFYFQLWYSSISLTILLVVGMYFLCYGIKNIFNRSLDGSSMSE